MTSTYNPPSDSGKIFNQPRGFFIPFYVQLFMFVGFSMIIALTTLYETKELGFTDSHAYTLFAAYYSLLYGLPFLGGYLGGRLLGSQLAITLGLVFATIGLLVLSFPALLTLYIGLGFFVVGITLIIPNINVVLGRLYEPDDYRRDSGFTFNYVGYNISGFIAILSSGYIVRQFGYSTAFFISMLFSLASLLIFLIGLKRLTKAIKAPSEEVFNNKSKLLGVFISIITIPIAALLFDHSKFNDGLLLLAGITAVALIIFFALREKEAARTKLFVFLVLLIIGLAFWSLYALEPTVFALFIDRNVNRHILQSTIPTSSLLSLNPLFIVLSGILLIIVWGYLEKRGLATSIPAKFAIAVILMGSGYFVLLLGIHYANASGLIGLGWIIFSYFLQTFGELFIGPIGFSMVGTLVPKRLENLMMGIWQLTVGISSALSGYMAQLVTTPDHLTNPLQTNPVYSHSFLLYGSIAIIIGIIAALASPKLTRMIGQ